MDASWLSLCQAPESITSELNVNIWDYVLLHTATNHDVASMVLQIVVLPGASDVLMLHALVFEVLCRGKTNAGVKNTTGNYSIAPLTYLDVTLPDEARKDWTMEKCNVLQLPRGSTIVLQIVYIEEGLSNKKIARLLENRVIRETTTVVLSESCIAICVSIQWHGMEDPIHETTAVRVGTVSTFQLEISLPLPKNVPNLINEPIIQQNCPGYDSLLHDLLVLTEKRPGRPTGIILTGCPGVGKTKLATALLGATTHAHMISAQDLWMQASWATESDMLDLLLPPTSKCSLVIIDDLHVLEETESETNHNNEYMLVRNTLQIAIDQLVNQGISILGIAHDRLRIPPELTKVGRLEVCREMLSPSQAQRDTILMSLLKRQDWANALSGALAGCVAADLVHLCAEAAAKSSFKKALQWEDLKEAARQCIPSQLALLDVTKTPICPIEGADYATIHDWAWRDFGGYREIKKRIFRTIVMPWRRYLDGEIDSFSISPPRGVLFHGVPGVGKTLAAGCLASSLGLHVVRVRASDVLDKWLGGSEAALRSLFARARGAAPCILFFDEIDAIASNRDNTGTENDVSSRILSTFLNELDGVSSDGSSGVLVVACTNRVQDLDTALLRPGRIEEHVPLARPDQNDTHQILQLSLAKVPKADDIHLSDITSLLFELNATGADIDGVCRDACSHAIHTASDFHDFKLTNDHIDTAMKRWKGYT